VSDVAELEGNGPAVDDGAPDGDGPGCDVAELAGDGPASARTRSPDDVHDTQQSSGATIAQSSTPRSRGSTPNRKGGLTPII